jgi:hypothetical protein
MKLRFKNNSLRLRLNQLEVRNVASGAVLKEQVHFPGGASMSYTLEQSATAAATFAGGDIRIGAPQQQVARWAGSEDIGIYFELPANGTLLKVAIEKDLECIDGPPDDRDPDAFPRSEHGNC